MGRRLSCFDYGGKLALIIEIDIKTPGYAKVSYILLENIRRKLNSSTIPACCADCSGRASVDF